MKAPWPFGHLGLKALSLGLAVMLWLFVSGDAVVERGLRVPLEFSQFPAGLEMMGDMPSLVDVRVRGASSALSLLGPGDIVAQLDLKSATPGRRLYQLTPEQVRVPYGVQVVQVMPPTVALAFETSATRSVPVVPAVEGDPAPGFVVGKVVVDPPTVDVVGPRSAVEQVTEALTEPVSVAGASAMVTDGVTVGFQDGALRLKVPRQARVTVEVMPGPVERTLHQRPVHFENLRPSLIARPDPSSVDVVLRGSREGVNRVASDEVTASVDVAGLGPGSYTLPVRVDNPARAGVARILPATVQVQITSGKD
ncbi:MAG: YbbR-like domain-containing protein [Vicinamibacterales bacterium]